MTDDAMPGPDNPGVPNPSRAAEAARRARLRELTPKTMWMTAAVIAVLTAGAVLVLWWPATAGLTGKDLVTARLDALKIGLSIGIGSGGIVALYLSWRRQQSTEADLDNRERALQHQQASHAADLAQRDAVADATKHDAAERRLTELYLKAVEQLGSPQAAVRHGGLYALERVAQDNPPQRQTVVNVICAYLRNPYIPPVETSAQRRLGVRRPLLRSAAPHPSTPRPDAQARVVQLQEREVRLTAQGILQRHLHPGEDPEHDLFWSGIDLDLTGATLINFSLKSCKVRDVSFRNAVFVVFGSFIDTTFDGTAWFDEATFVGPASFAEATFADAAVFGGATFAKGADFNHATFAGAATFRKAEFAGVTVFNLANFADVTVFERATFVDRAVFTYATFAGFTEFCLATFLDTAEFSGARFTGRAGFAEAIFAGGARFEGATYEGRAFSPVASDITRHEEDSDTG
ncbi:pentapeptide repeat-containing protein [Amycolatopsis kentuckyensis]|uniref:pentapeptide repeat-containing protein n=1 Tax=Amycolatopsis kentuckyensis TaxID=218823 RepID=UPI003564CAF4